MLNIIPYRMPEDLVQISFEPDPSEAQSRDTVVADMPRKARLFIL